MTKLQVLQCELQDKMEYFQWLIKDMESASEQDFAEKMDYFQWVLLDINKLTEQIEQLQGADYHEAI